MEGRTGGESRLTDLVRNSLTGERDGRYDDLSMASSNAFGFITQGHEAGVENIILFQL